MGGSAPADFMESGVGKLKKTGPTKKAYKFSLASVNVDPHIN